MNKRILLSIACICILAITILNTLVFAPDPNPPASPQATSEVAVFDTVPIPTP